MSLTRQCVLIVSSLAFCVGTLHADDWPQWRGNGRDAKLSQSEQLQSLPSGEITRKWTIPLGPGYSGPTVADGLVYVTDHGARDADGEPIDQGEVERVICVDRRDGSLVWQHVYDAPYTIQYRAGPRAAVTVTDGVALAVGAMGHLHCLDAKTGAVRWKHDLNAEYKINMPIWGITASPLVHNGWVIQIVGGSNGSCVVAFDLETGAERWRSIDERAGYSSPVIVRQADQEVLVCWSGESLSGLDPETGKTHWRIEMLPRNMPIGVPTPIVQDDLVFVSSFYDGSLLVRLDSQKLDATTVWRRIGVDEKNTDALHCMISNPFFKGDHIYGVDSYGQLRCLSLDNGDRVWESDQAVQRNRWATVHTIQNGDREIMLNEQGELIDATVSPSGFTLHSRGFLISPTKLQLPRRDGVVWSHPAISNGEIFARNDAELICAPLR
ncbi:outer membrane protein assembly factor BamB family protein [Stieleria varia]|uniref:Quinohemoprotein alcohol dehydrogenase ADH-IIG n=1 Tax=Stieleria varia TaxID=2528005 RepID=A0A5C6AWS1_9BACT|nr:PQQ-binding-like beta-propeller repeat protein [Stieleria varia]TWU04465.1 Quinohemoprotein alcohol dehydrogenase ADH-IIG precursor [Stieleria varia]